MKLLTINCHSWQEENQMEKIEYLAKTIYDENIDVVALQEVSQLISNTGYIKGDNYMVYLVKELNLLSKHKYNYIWTMSHIGYDKYDEGLAILTPHKIENYESFYVSRSKDKTNYKTRKIIKADININETSYQFLSCHLGWWDDENEPYNEQVDNLLKHVSSEKTIFIMGDFNNDAFIEGEGYDYLISKGLYDTFKIAKEKDNGVTVRGKIDGWNESVVDKRLDLIFSNKAVCVNTSRSIFNGNYKKIISDHYGVVVNIEK